jgi:hypothetical protein
LKGAIQHGKAETGSAGGWQFPKELEIIKCREGNKEL